MQRHHVPVAITLATTVHMRFATVNFYDYKECRKASQCISGTKITQNLDSVSFMKATQKNLVYHCDNFCYIGHFKKNFLIYITLL